MRINLLSAAIQTALPVYFDAHPLQRLPIHPAWPAELASALLALHMVAPPNLHNIPPAQRIRTPLRRPRDHSPRRHVLSRPTLHLRALLVLRAGLAVAPGTCPRCSTSARSYDSGAPASPAPRDAPSPSCMRGSGTTESWGGRRARSGSRRPRACMLNVLERWALEVRGVGMPTARMSRRTRRAGSRSG